MAGKRSQYQPHNENGHTLTDTQEVLYTKDFKAADIAAGYRRQKVRQVKRES